jgi:nucleotide-binding universal stress UspA family protein
MRVLVAIDGSASSQLVVEEAAARPWPAGAEFAVISVVDLRGMAEVPGLIEEAQQAANGFVKAAEERLSRVGLKARSETFLAFPRSGIVEYAKGWGANLVMTGSHGQGAITRFVLGSVAQGVLRAAPCSVEIVRPGVDGKPPSRGAMKILLTADGTEFSLAAAKSVTERPWPAGSEIKLLSVVEYIVLENQMAAAPLAAIYPPKLLEELLNNARSRAKEAVEASRKILDGGKIRVAEQECTATGDPKIVVLEQAEKWGANLIVLGSHGRRGLDRVLMGSVSESVAMHAHCSVEVIRA